MASHQQHRQYEEDDESDSSFIAARRRPPVVARIQSSCQNLEGEEEEEPDENKPLDLTRPIRYNNHHHHHHQTPTVVIRRPAPSSSLLPPPRVAPVVSTSSKSPAAANNRKIAKIVDSLILKKRQQSQSPKPPVVVAKPGHYRAILLANLNKLDKENDEVKKSSDEFANLSWLGHFNIASTPGFVPLSPPQSPPIEAAAAAVATAARNSDEDECDSTSRNQHLAKRVRLNPNLVTSNVAVHKSLKKPAITFSCLAFLAIESAPRKRLSVKEIYTWVIENFPYYGHVPSGSWKNSIRHNLASNACFSKVDKNLLAMRDFSGKGSLWCVSPFYRPSLVEALARSGTDYFELSRMACLQDVREQPQQQASHIVSTPKTSNHHTGQSSSSSSNSGFRSRSASNLSYNSYPKPTLNPRLLVGGAATSIHLSSVNPRLSQVTITNVSKISKSSMALNQPQTSAASNQQHLNDNYSELDAVKALLSMKSRSSSSSVPFSSSSATAMTTKSSNSNVEEKETRVEEEQPKRGRRKQVFKRPVKTPTIEREDDHDDEDFVGSPKSDEIDLGDLDDDDDHDYEADDDDEIDNYLVAHNYTSPHKTLKSCSKRVATMKQNSNNVMCGNNKAKKPGKLLVKFTSFHNKAAKGRRFEEEEEEEEDDDEEIEEGEIVRKDKKKRLSDEERLRIDDDNDDNESHSNPLLELSRAAYLVEEKTNKKK